MIASTFPLTPRTVMCPSRQFPVLSIIRRVRRSADVAGGRHPRCLAKAVVASFAALIVKRSYPLIRA